MCIPAIWTSPQGALLMHQPSFCTWRKLKPNVTLLRSSGGQSGCFCVQWVFLLCALGCERVLWLVLLSSRHCQSSWVCCTRTGCTSVQLMATVRDLESMKRTLLWFGPYVSYKILYWYLNLKIILSLCSCISRCLIGRLHAREWTHIARQAHRSRYTLSALLSQEDASAHPAVPPSEHICPPFSSALLGQSRNSHIRCHSLPWPSRTPNWENTFCDLYMAWAVTLSQ